MNWYVISKKSKKKKQPKEKIVSPFGRSMIYAQMGEWWLVNGVAEFADADVGDVNHSGYVIGSVLSDHDFEPERFDLNKENEQSLKLKGFNDEEINVLLDKVDPREYGLRHYGWQRVKGNHVQTQTLTPKDLKNIANGLWDANNDLTEEDVTEFNIEVVATGAYYTDIPYSIICKENPALLREYQKVYAKRNNWYKYAQIWNVNTEGDIEEKLTALYELEYKYSMVRDRPFSGLSERHDNILMNLEEKLEEVVEDVKDTLLRVFGKWLESHALLSADTWAEKRIEDLLREEGDIKGAYQNMVSEYMRYAIYHGQYHSPTDQSAHDRFFNEILDKAKKNIRYFPYLSRIFEGGLYDYKNMLMDDLESEGLKEFSDRMGKRFKNEEQAKNWINSLTVNKVDPDSLFYSEGIDGFVNIVHNLGYENEVLKELYKKFVFPHWVEYWRSVGIAETRKTIANIYRKLQGISSSDVRGAMAIISLALNASHQTGEMMDYIAQEAGGSGSASEVKALLDDLSSGSHVEDWNRQLKEVGVQV
jgi:hypothetical protein